MKNPDDMPAPARNTHKHGCGHFDGCYTPKIDECQKCRTKAFNDAMAASYREDSMSAKELLERRA